MSYYDSPFESVRGPVITAFDQAVPKVSGQGGAWAGYGKLKVETQIVHERSFWLLLPNGQHYHCDLGDSPMPAMLPTHDVEVKVAGGIIHAITNHTTGERMVYRDYDSPGSLYRPEQTPIQAETEGGIRTLAIVFFGALCLGAPLAGASSGAAGFLAGCGASLVIGLSAWWILHRSERQGMEDRAHNARLDYWLERDSEDQK